MVYFIKCCLRLHHPSPFLLFSRRRPVTSGLCIGPPSLPLSLSSFSITPRSCAGHQMTSSRSPRRSQVSSFQPPPVPLPWSAAGHAGRGDICLSEDKGMGCLTFRLSPPHPRTTTSLFRYSDGSDLICGIVSCQAGGQGETEEFKHVKVFGTCGFTRWKPLSVMTRGKTKTSAFEQFNPTRKSANYLYWPHIVLT